MTSVLTIIVAVPIGLALLLYFSQERMIFLRAPAPLSAPQVAGLTIGAVTLAVGENLTLRGWMARPANAKSDAKSPLAIYFGGNAEEVSGMAMLADRFPGWSLLAANYRGYGGNPGEPSERVLLADALAWYDWAVARADMDPHRVVAFGRSLGSGVAVHVAAERAVAGVVLITPFDSLRAVAQRHYPYMPVGLLLKHPFDSLKRAPGILAPLLVVAAERDRIVPAAHAKVLYSAWRGPKILKEIARADHNDLDADPDYWKAVAGFFETLRGSGQPGSASNSIVR
jgi:uncharacterized protein